jgi:hypothetical protein
MFHINSDRRALATALIASALLSTPVAFAQNTTLPMNNQRAIKGNYDGTAVVSPVPGDPAASGQALRKTLNNLNPSPSASFRWLVKIEPGTYDLGGNPLSMRQFVDIEGGGIAATTLRGNVGPDSGAAAREDLQLDSLTQGDAAVAGLNQGLIVGASNAELRQLTVECVPTAAQPACMVMLNDAASPRLTNLRLRVTAPSGGSHWGMRNYDAAPLLDHVVVEVSGAQSGDNYGIVNVGQTAQTVTDLRNSTITVSGAQATNNFAVLNRRFAKVHPVLSSTLTATGGLHAAGLVYSPDAGLSGDFYVQHTTITASGGSEDSIGIQHQNSGDDSVRPIIQFSSVSGNTHGILLSFNNSVVVEDSELYGTQFAVAAAHVDLTRTWIRGGDIFGAQSETCTDVEDPNHILYPDTCP